MIRGYQKHWSRINCFIKKIERDVLKSQHIFLKSVSFIAHIYTHIYVYTRLTNEKSANLNLIKKIHSSANHLSVTTRRCYIHMQVYSLVYLYIVPTRRQIPTQKIKAIPIPPRNKCLVNMQCTYKCKYKYLKVQNVFAWSNYISIYMYLYIIWGTNKIIECL